LGLYIAFAVLIGFKTASHAVRTVSPELYFRLNGWIALRARLWEAPLFTHRHLAPIPILGIKAFTFQAPLRYQALVILILGFVNVIPLFHFYWFISGDRNA
jgi:hypothetical protein